VVVEKYFLRRVHHTGMRTSTAHLRLSHHRRAHQAVLRQLPVDYRIPDSMDFALFRMGATNYRPTHLDGFGRGGHVHLLYLLLTRTPRGHRRAFAI